MISWINVLQIIIILIGITFQIILSISGYSFGGILVSLIFNMMAFIMVILYIFAPQEKNDE